MENSTTLGELDQVLTAEEANGIKASTYLTRKEAAQYLNVGEQTLANHKYDGPKMHKFFGSVRYSVADLNDWARQQRM